MGCRAIRICLRRPDIFITQVRALLRASAYGKLSVLIPMVTSLDEVRHVKQTVASCMAELREEKIPFAKVELGVMIETPSAAILSDQLANEVDFFSFGTNDLTQYVLAVDRMNASISELYDPAHPAVLRLMRIAAANAAKNGIWCAVCGESGSNTDLTELYLSMGITEFSVAPSSILRVRDKICSIDLSKQEVSFV
jgi:phosphotransferase system enzyme I (PtsI)